MGRANGPRITTVLGVMGATRNIRHTTGYDQGNAPNYSSCDHAGNYAPDKGSWGYKPKTNNDPHNARYYKDQRNQAPKFAPPVCERCGKAHNPNKPCKQYGVYATNTFSCENAVIKDPYIVPLFLKGQKVSALRDTGNAGLVLVDKRLVPTEAYIPNAYVFCKGVFDKDIKRKIPLAEVTIRSPRFQFNKDVLVRVGVCELPHGIDCNVGNELFQTHPELTDIIAFRRDMDTTTGVLEMQDLAEPMTSDDCDTDLHGDQTAATYTDDTAQMITRSMMAQRPPQQERGACWV